MHLREAAMTNDCWPFTSLFTTIVVGRPDLSPAQAEKNSPARTYASTQRTETCKRDEIALRYRHIAAGDVAKSLSANA
ncbi:hypothetical protein LY41_001281 [Prauserella halophila]|nr:hypothetical protein [Prauserella halophila]